MGKFLAVLLSGLASIIFILCLFFSVLQFTINDGNFIAREYEKLSLGAEMGLSDADLAAACLHLVDYMEGREAHIALFVNLDGQQTLLFDQEQEISHMADVRLLYQNFRSWRNWGLLLSVLFYGCAVLLQKRSAVATLAAGYQGGTLLVVIALAVLGGWAALDFSDFWTFFHETLFWNDDWMFDMTTSRMINMLPEAFFADVILRVILIGGLLCTSLFLLAAFAKKRFSVPAFWQPEKTPNG